MLTKLTHAILNYITTPFDEVAYQETLATYRANPRDDTKRETLITFLQEKQKALEPLENILAQAWMTALEKASENSLINPLDEGNAQTIFSEVWTPLQNNGWKSLPDYRHDQLSTSLAQTLRNAYFDCGNRPEKTPEAMAQDLLDQIASGTLPKTPGAGDYFINFADGSPLWITMDNWTPVLRDSKNRKPSAGPEGMVFANIITFESGKALVSDRITTGPLTDQLSKVREMLGLNINYGWHRVWRTTHSMSALHTIDIDMGSDGPGLVKNPQNPLIFAGQDDATHSTIASICHDYWGTTMVDTAHLITMMVKENTAKDKKDAQEQINEWLESSPYHNEIDVPKKAYVYWDDDRQTLAKALSEAGIEAPQDVRMVISPEKLSLNESYLRFLGTSTH